ncbi:hypothetical protein OPT61_g9344 [Boeremia exigua]|uniref:Uncharacterized protein n=1 Tax=Boeremia exigua TaxID=749465 RepID=A0ACC2HUU7_9PLEO|nr:hypothetical protein OPT61_g9344 [Boeremia exigua]
MNSDPGELFGKGSPGPRGGLRARSVKGEAGVRKRTEGIAGGGPDRPSFIARWKDRRRQGRERGNCDLKPTTGPPESRGKNKDALSLTAADPRPMGRKTLQISRFVRARISESGATLAILLPSGNQTVKDSNVYKCGPTGLRRDMALATLLSHRAPVCQGLALRNRMLGAEPVESRRWQTDARYTAIKAIRDPSCSLQDSEQSPNICKDMGVGDDISFPPPRPFVRALEQALEQPNPQACRSGTHTCDAGVQTERHASDMSQCVILLFLLAVTSSPPPAYPIAVHRPSTHEDKATAFLGINIYNECMRKEDT